MNTCCYEFPQFLNVKYIFTFEKYIPWYLQFEYISLFSQPFALQIFLFSPFSLFSNLGFQLYQYWAFDIASELLDTLFCSFFCSFICLCFNLVIYINVSLKLSFAVSSLLSSLPKAFVICYHLCYDRQILTYISNESYMADFTTPPTGTEDLILYWHRILGPGISLTLPQGYIFSFTLHLASVDLHVYTGAIGFFLRGLRLLCYKREGPESVYVLFP